MPRLSSATAQFPCVRSAEGAAAFQTAFLSSALELDESQTSEIRGLLLAAYQTFFAENYASAGRPHENADAWWQGRRRLNRETTSAIAAGLSPMQQVRFKQLVSDHLLFYTSFSQPSGVLY